jgi:hypothetical protein
MPPYRGYNTIEWHNIYGLLHSEKLPTEFFFWALQRKPVKGKAQAHSPGIEPRIISFP